MIIKNPRFEISAVKANQYPKNGLPEVVLVGKSNVGKSSFINTMINRKNWLVLVVNLEKLANLIFIIWTINFILLTCLVTAIAKCLNKNKLKLVNLLNIICNIARKFV